MTSLEAAILGLVFLFTVGCIVAAAAIVARRTSTRKRMQMLQDPDRGLSAAVSVDAQASGTLQRLAEPVARIALPDTEDEVTRFRSRFLHAGISSRSAPTLFFATKALLALGLPLVSWVVIQLAHGSWSNQRTLMALLFAAALGYYLPNVVLDRRVKARQEEILQAFPDAIDLMVVCVEAGLALDMAIQRAAQEMAMRSRHLAAEFALLGTELRIGASRQRALLNLSTRTGVPEVQMFVSMLLQADRFGTSMAESMRVHADDLRVRRQMRAEETASKIPTKLLFPLMLTIFPALLVVLLGPAAIGIADGLTGLRAR